MGMVVALLNNAEHPWAMCTVVEGSRSSSDLAAEQGGQIKEVLLP